MKAPQSSTPCATTWVAALALLLLCAPGHSQTKPGGKPFQVDNDTAALWVFDQDPEAFVDDQGPSGVSLKVQPENGEEKRPTLVPGKFGKALFFPGNIALSGAEDHVIETPEKVTLEAWINLDPSAENIERGVFEYGAPGPGGFRMTIHANGRLTWIVMDETGTEIGVTSEFVVPVDEWVHIAGTYDGANLQVYIAGELAGEKPLEKGVTQGRGFTRVGLISAAGPPCFRGAIEAIRISKVARTKFDVP